VEGAAMAKAKKNIKQKAKCKKTEITVNLPV